MKVKLFSKPNCGPCRATEHVFITRGIDFEKIDVTKDPEAMTFLSETLGYRSVPVVYVDEGNHWGGFDLDRINAIT